MGMDQKRMPTVIRGCRSHFCQKGLFDSRARIPGFPTANPPTGMRIPRIPHFFHFARLQAGHACFWLAGCSAATAVLPLYAVHALAGAGAGGHVPAARAWARAGAAWQCGSVRTAKQARLWAWGWVVYFMVVREGGGGAAAMHGGGACSPRLQCRVHRPMGHLPRSKRLR